MEEAGNKAGGDRPPTTPRPQAELKRARMNFGRSEASDALFWKLKKINGYSESSIKNALGDFRKICHVLKTEDTASIVSSLENAVETMEKISESDLTKTTKDRVVAGLPRIYKALTEQEMPEEPRKVYRKRMLETAHNYQIEITHRKATERLPLYTDFMEQVLHLYGENSEQYLIISLYHELTARDDFSQLVIHNKYNSTITSYNYCVVALNQPVEIILNVYKYCQTRGPIRVTLSNEASKRVKTYAVNQGLKFGGYLFPQKSLSQCVGRILERCGLSGGISTLRRMVVSEAYNDPETTYQEMVELADKMGHTTQKAVQIYHRANVEKGEEKQGEEKNEEEKETVTK